MSHEMPHPTDSV